MLRNSGVGRALSSGAFRFAFAMALVFAVGAAALLVVVNRSIDHYASDAVADATASEVAILIGEDRSLGRAELIAAIARHQQAMVERRLRYLLITPAGRRIAGDLPIDAARVGSRQFRLEVCPRGRDCMVPLAAEGVRLSDGAVLVVANDITDLLRLRHELSEFTKRVGVAIALFVLIGGLATGGLFLRRLDRVNASIARIVEGRFAERLPPIGMGPEFDRLSANLNAMLDRIEVLMDGLRQVSIDVAHDLRTPLTRLRQRLERLEGDVPTASRGEVRETIAQADQVLDIFAALLRIGAMESGRAREGFARVDLTALLTRIGAAYAPEIEDGGRSLTLDLSPGIFMLGDSTLMAQAVANLVENAAAHTPVGTRISLALRPTPGALKIVVSDDGPGIPVDERGKVTRRFYRLDRSRTTAGAGLGLALAAAVARVHGGELALGDAGPGLEVRLHLPAD